VSNPSTPISNKQLDGYNRILDVAETLFQERGYSSVSMRDIAESVGVRQASLYYHFPNKEQLFVSVRERGFERHRVGLQNAFSRADRDLRSQLQAAADWFLSQPPIKFLGMMQSDMPSLTKEAEQHLGRVSFQSTFEPIMQIFVLAQADGKIRHVQPKLLTGFFLSVLESIPFVFKPGETATKEEMAQEMISVLLKGIEID
jgi:TetR/AcrR family transcriptional regulator, cholesterol catabolism regulator